MTIREGKIYTQARMMATDADLCRIFDMTPQLLERHRRLIDQARSEAMVSLRFDKARATVKRLAKGGGE